MHRLTALSLASLLALAQFTAGCGGKEKPPEVPDDRANETPGDDDGGVAEGDTEKPPAEKKDECTSADFTNLEETLLKSSCEEAEARPETLTPIDLKGKLEVTLTASPTKVTKGTKADLLVMYANKSKEPLTLHFRIDPLPRFEVEAFDAKSKRADLPPGKPPPAPKGQNAPPPSEAKTARVTLAPGGSARAHVQWEAVRTRWAPEKVRGTPPERGYPRSPAGPLPKGKYTVRVVTPLVGVAESEAHEMTAPRVEIENGG